MDSNVSFSLSKLHVLKLVKYFRQLASKLYQRFAKFNFQFNIIQSTFYKNLVNTGIRKWQTSC